MKETLQKNIMLSVVSLLLTSINAQACGPMPMCPAGTGCGNTVVAGATVQTCLVKCTSDAICGFGIKCNGGFCNGVANPIPTNLPIGPGIQIPSGLGPLTPITATLSSSAAVTSAQLANSTVAPVVINVTAFPITTISFQTTTSISTQAAVTTSNGEKSVLSAVAGLLVALAL
ncbi:hypothetical protein HDV06_004432 [Boothiomyces sp. JEL0866]|nr:hypothetical protein HDV06_004432 [Boothiomyces sp. JEL0866]